MRYIIDCTLLSDTIPGSGEGIAGSVDMDVPYNEFGIPYIPAKRLKGILREQAEALEQKLIQHSVEEIFGREGNDSLGHFKISNGQIQNYLDYLYTIQNLAKSSRKFSRSEILAWFTTERASTTIDLTTGSAKKGTLRTMRVLRKGLVFEFPVKFNPKFESDIDLICKSTTHMGISRTRGFGHIQLVLKKINDAETAPHGIKTDLPAGMNRLKIRVRNVEPLLITSEVGKNQKTMQFIPGNMLRGALSYLYIKENQLQNPHENSEFRKLFLDGELRFLPGFPVIQDKRSTPSPACIVKLKDENKYLNLLNSDDINYIEQNEEQTKGNLKAFYVSDNGKIYHSTPDTYIEYHHRRPENKELGSPVEGDGEFFQFEVLAENQLFEFVVEGAEDNLRKLVSLLENHPELYLGKSKSAQYGKCEIISILGEKVEQETIFLEKGSQISILCESDLIVRNEHGFPEPSLTAFEATITRHHSAWANKIKVCPENSYLKFRFLSGFKGVWRLEKPHIQAIAAGSIITIKNQGTDKIDITDLFKTLQGYYTEEGYGKLVPFALADKSFQQVTVESNALTSAPIFKGTEKRASDFEEFLLMQRALRQIRANAMRRANQALPISNSQISYFMHLIRLSSSFEEIKEHLSDLRKRKSDQLKKVHSKLFLSPSGMNDTSFRVNESSFKNYLKENVFNQDKGDEKNNLEESWLEDRKRLYQFYAEYILTLLSTTRIKKRGVAHAE